VVVKIMPEANFLAVKITPRAGCLMIKVKPRADYLMVKIKPRLVCPMVKSSQEHCVCWSNLVGTSLYGVGPVWQVVKSSQ
jgi:hypothetical protein